MPVGTPGELYVGGLCVGGGYVNNPERTAAAFVPDPFGESPEVLAYRTGDRGLQLADGGFEFLGRIDTQLKIRGHRIELGEVERALATVETLQESAVTVRADGEHGKQLVGFYVPKAVQNSGAAAGDTLLRLEVSPVELRDRLGSLLPRYAVPDYLIALGELPRTPHGKVDTKALAAWDLTDLDTTTQDDSLPPTPTEAAVIEVWAGVLRTARPPHGPVQLLRPGRTLAARRPGHGPPQGPVRRGPSAAPALREPDPEGTGPAGRGTRRVPGGRRHAPSRITPSNDGRGSSRSPATRPACGS